MSWQYATKRAGLFALCCATVLAESKAEADLRRSNEQLARDLAVSEAKLATSNAERQIIRDTLNKLTAAQVSDSKKATRHNLNVEQQQGAQIAVQAANGDHADVNAALQRQAVSTQTVQLVAAMYAARWTAYSTIIVAALGSLATIFTILWASRMERIRHGWTLGKIAEVKTSADAAYSEANHVNLKLETIGVEMKDRKPLNDT